MRHYLTCPETGTRHYAPSPEDDPAPHCCPWCGSVEVENEGDRCDPCTALKAEKEADTMPYNPIAAAMQLDPRIARILTGKAIPADPAAPPDDGREPTRGGSGVSDTRTIEEVCRDILAIADRIRRSTP